MAGGGCNLRAEPSPLPLSRPLPPPSPGEGNRPPEEKSRRDFSLFSRCGRREGTGEEGRGDEGLPPFPDLLDLQRRAAAGGGAGEQAGHAHPLAVVEAPQIAGQIVRRAVAVAHRRAGAVEVERAVHADRLGSAAAGVTVLVAGLVIRGLVVVLAAVRIVLGRRRLALPVRTILIV